VVVATKYNDDIIGAEAVGYHSPFRLARNDIFRCESSAMEVWETCHLTLQGGHSSLQGRDPSL